MPIETRRKTCRLCDGDQINLVVHFAPTSIADAFVAQKCLNEIQKTYPLDMYFCRQCGHVQLLDAVDPRLLFSEYTYMSSASPGLVKHFSEYVDSVMTHFQPPPGSLVVDIGSNDGTLLKFFKEKGLKVLGVDPAREITRKATEAGIETLPEFFTLDVARRIRKQHGPAQVITANNVFAHADDLGGMLDSIRELLAPDGIFVFEASYLVDVVDKMLLGTIFHEHLSYHTVQPLKSFLTRHHMELADVERVSIQGGSIIGFAQKMSGPLKIAPIVNHLIEEERARRFDQPQVYEAFAIRVNALRDQVRKLLQEFKSQGRSIAGFGAARGGTTLIYHFGLGDYLEYIVDDNPEKHFLYSPGLHIPVLPSQEIYKRNPGYLFLLAWVHAKPIMEKHRAYMEQGGHFIIAHPKLEVVSMQSFISANLRFT